MEKKHLRSWKKVFENDLFYIANELKEGTERPCVVILTGEMGVGKTTFMKTFTKDARLTSSTYNLVNEAGPFLVTDFYRVEKEEDLLALELGLYAENKDTVFIEWGSRYQKYLYRELGDRFKYYELVIEANPSKEGTPSRNYNLFSLDPLN